MKRIVIYGAGANCKNVIKGSIKNQYEIVALSDKDKEKIGKLICGYEIISPDKIRETQCDGVVVSVIDHFSEIKEYLEKQGIPKEKIFHYTEILKLSPLNIGSMKITADWNSMTIHELYGELCSHVNEMSDLEKDFLTGKHNHVTKWMHYFEVYNRYLEKYRGREVTIMEIGVFKGGSLKLWKNYFGSKAKIIGVDINPDCKRFEEEQIEIYIGNQEDRNFWKEMREKLPKIDILIDDGGHFMNQQIVTFEEMFPHISDKGGVYICEDTGTSYGVKTYQSGGYKAQGTFIEYTKNFVDYINAWFSEQEELQINEYTRSMHAIHYYTGMVVVEKKAMGAPFDMAICNNGVDKYADVRLLGHEFE